MQLAGAGAFGPPADRDAAIAVLRRAVELGVNHIDTAQYYGPDVANDLIREALHPYPADLAIVSKVGAVRDAQGAWLPALQPHELRAGVEDNLRSLKIDQLAAVNLRLLGPEAGDHQPPPLERCAAAGVAYVPFFPLGSAFPGIPKVTDQPAVRQVADRLGATPAQV